MTAEIAAARKARAKRDAPERKRIAAHKRLIAEVERIAHRGGKPVATGQTIVKSRMSEAPLTRLKRLDKLDAHELTAAEDIVAAYHLTIGAKIVDDPDLGIRHEPDPDRAEESATKRIDLLQHYQRWRRELANTPWLAAAIAMLLDEVPGRAVDRAQGRRNGTTEQQMLAAVRHFAAIRGNTPRGVRWRLPIQTGPLADAVLLAKLVPHPNRPEADSSGHLRTLSAPVLTAGPGSARKR